MVHSPHPRTLTNTPPVVSTVEATLRSLGIPFVLLQGNPLETVPGLVIDGAFSLLVRLRG